MPQKFIIWLIFLFVMQHCHALSGEIPNCMKRGWECRKALALTGLSIFTYFDPMLYQRQKEEEDYWMHISALIASRGISNIINLLKLADRNAAKKK